MTVQVAALSESPVAEPGIPRYELVPWREEHGLVAGMTVGRDYNLGLWTDDRAARVLDRWMMFLGDTGEQFAGAVVARQVHGALVAVHRKVPSGLLVVAQSDGHVTTEAGLLLGVTVADCVPVYLAHPPSGSIGLLHAGWRGVAAGILARGVQALTRLAQSSVESMVMHCGISICGACYEVGPEVIEALTGARGARPRGCDLREILAGQAGRLGVGRVSVSGWCTAHDGDPFSSHRASGGRAGRMLAYLGRPMA